MSQPLSYVLLTDAPPLKHGGSGGNAHTWNWLRTVGTGAKLVVTRRMDPSLELDQIARDLPVPACFYPDLSRGRGLGRLRFLKSLLEIGLLILSLRRIEKAIKASGAKRIFAFFGADAWFLLVAVLMRWKTGLPMDVYLVDDLEDWARFDGHPLWARFVRWLEPWVLARVERVFVISPSYVDHLRQKYSLQSLWLPMLFGPVIINYSPYIRQKPEVRELVYLGSVNYLYISAINDLLKTIAEWNSGTESYKIKLILMSATNPDYIMDQVAPSPHWELLHRRSDEECFQRMRNSWAVFLPYSFEPKVQVMVSTSFPSRLARCIAAGRPLLAYGPSYSSLCRYFTDNNLPLCIQSQQDLKAGLRRIEAIDSPNTIEHQRQVIELLHGEVAIRERLAGG